MSRKYNQRGIDLSFILPLGEAEVFLLSTQRQALRAQQKDFRFAQSLQQEHLLIVSEQYTLIVGTTDNKGAYSWKITPLSVATGATTGAEGTEFIHAMIELGVSAAVILALGITIKLL